MEYRLLFSIISFSSLDSYASILLCFRWATSFF